MGFSATMNHAIVTPEVTKNLYVLMARDQAEQL